VLPLDENGNCVKGGPVCVDAENCVVYGENVRVGVVGVSNLIIVASDKGVLVCETGRDQDTRRIARMFEDEGEE
jgi:mannose-1-phosphate guanylyltransferase